MDKLNHLIIYIMSQIFSNDNTISNTKPNPKNYKKIKMEKARDRIDSISDSENDEVSDDVTTILKLSEIMKTIPKNTKDKQDSELSKKYVEWRWRFFDVNGRNLIEISRKDPNGERLYTDKNGSWIHFQLDNKWEKYLKKSLYYYSK
jgi:hypothetical protein